MERCVVDEEGPREGEAEIQEGCGRESESESSSASRPAAQQDNNLIWGWKESLFLHVCEGVRRRGCEEVR